MSKPAYQNKCDFCHATRYYLHEFEISDNKGNAIEGKFCSPHALEFYHRKTDNCQGCIASPSYPDLKIDIKNKCKKDK